MFETDLFDKLTFVFYIKHNSILIPWCSKKQTSILHILNNDIQ